jgi:hypothetical protein
VVDWSYAQPVAHRAHLPARERDQFVNEGGVPTRFSQMDQVVAVASRYGITVLPTVMYAPQWDVTGVRQNSYGRPARVGPFANFLTDLIERYGPAGTFWSTYYLSKQPIREW